MNETLDYLEALVRETDRAEEEILALAFRAGLWQLWRECVLARYLRGDLSRDKAIQEVGIDWVELAERQRRAVLEDLAWALGREARYGTRGEPTS